jgi:hypothetical protein
MYDAMTPLFKKLNFKDQPHIVVLNAPESFSAQVLDMQSFTQVHSDLKSAPNVNFVMAFCTQQAQVDSCAVAIAEQLVGDGIVWMVYPKGTSKRYQCEFNRDNGWAILGQLGFEPVRMVAIDEDWSALRFRRVEYIKTMTRSFAMTETGKQKTGQ